jgi:hypothetical protein
MSQVFTYFAYMHPDIKFRAAKYGGTKRNLFGWAKLTSLAPILEKCYLAAFVPSWASKYANIISYVRKD